MFQIHKLSNDFIGIKVSINNDNVTIPQRNLIVCIDNANMNYNTFTICTSYIPYIIYDLLTYINYKHICLIKNYPYLMNTHLDSNNIYRKFNSMERKNIKYYDVTNMIAKCCEDIDILKQSDDSYFDVLIVTQNKIYKKDWITLLQKLSTVASNIIYIYNSKNHEHLDCIYNDLNINCFLLNNDCYLSPLLLSDIENIILKDINHFDYIKATFDLQANYCLVNDNLFKIIENIKNICNIDIDMFGRRSEYFIVNSFDHESTIKSISSYINNCKQNLLINYDINNFDKLMFYKMFLEYCLNIDIVKLINEKSLLNYTLDLKSLISDIYTKNIGNEIGYFCVLLNKEYRILFTNFVFYLNNLGIKNTNEFLNLINNFSKIARLNVNNVRIAEKISINILKTINSINDDNNVPVLTLDENNEKLSLSRSFFNSMLTLTDWYEEIKLGNSIGILINLESNDLIKIGANGVKPKIHNITMTFLPIKDYIETALQLFKNHQKNDINDINIINSNIVGTGNAIIPLYICNEHWKVAKQHLKYILGIVLVNNPFAFIDSHLNFLFYMLTEMTCETFKIQLNDKWLQTYFAVYRTCSQIAYEKGYHKGIKKLVKKYIYEKERILNTRPFDNDVLFGQILSTGCLIDNADLCKFCDRMFEYVYWKNIIKYYDSYYFKNHLSKLSNDEIKDEFNNIIPYMDNKIIHEIETITYNYLMIIQMRQLFNKIGGFTKFIKTLDDNYGLASDDIISIKDSIQTNFQNINSKYLYQIIKMDDKYDVIMAEYIMRSLIYQKTKKRRISMQKNPQIWEIRSNDIIDVFNKYKNLVK